MKTFTCSTPFHNTPNMRKRISRLRIGWENIDFCHFIHDFLNIHFENHLFLISFERIEIRLRQAFILFFNTFHLDGICFLCGTHTNLENLTNFGVDFRRDLFFRFKCFFIVSHQLSNDHSTDINWPKAIWV